MVRAVNRVFLYLLQGSKNISSIPSSFCLVPVGPCLKIFHQLKRLSEVEGLEVKCRKRGSVGLSGKRLSRKVRAMSHINRMWTFALLNRDFYKHFLANHLFRVST